MLRIDSVTRLRGASGTSPTGPAVRSTTPRPRRDLGPYLGSAEHVLDMVAAHRFHRGHRRHHRRRRRPRQPPGPRAHPCGVVRRDDERHEGHLHVPDDAPEPGRLLHGVRRAGRRVRLADRGQAHLRRGGGGTDPGARVAGHPRCRGGDPGDIGQGRPLPPDPGRPRRRSVHRLQVADHGRRRRGSARGAPGVQRGRRTDVQDEG